MEAILDTVREFLGVSRPSPELDTVLSTVLFTDIVASTERQAGLGDRAWRDLVAAAPRDRPRSARALARRRERHGGRRVLRDVRRPRARDPVRAGRSSNAVRDARDRDPGRRAHRRVRADRRQAWWYHRVDRRTRGRRGGRVRGARLPDGEGPRRGKRAHVRGRRRARAEGRPGPLAPLSCDRAMASHERLATREPTCHTSEIWHRQPRIRYGSALREGSWRPPSSEGN